MEASELLVAAGRTPNTQGIRADLAGVELDSRGYVQVNERLETTAPGVWAMGDCAGSPQFTHVAFDDFRIVRDNLNGGSRTIRNRLVPFCMFTDPELARVGLNELEAKARMIVYRLARMPVSAVLRTRTISEPRGFMKMLIDEESDRILGFTVFGAEASELLATVQTAMFGNLPYTALRDALFTHPTAAEGLTLLLTNVTNDRQTHQEDCGCVAPLPLFGQDHNDESTGADVVNVALQVLVLLGRPSITNQCALKPCEESLVGARWIESTKILLAVKDVDIL
jgi:hypothetical protein